MAQLSLQTQLRVAAPCGESIEVIAASAECLRIHCASKNALYDLLRLTTRLPFYRGPFHLRQFNNPLAQTIELRVGDRTWLRWPAGERAQIKSWRLLWAWVVK
jgi:hypothetical protein